MGLKDWRVSYKLDTILDEDLSGAGVSQEFYWSGFDREGRPCLVFRAVEHKKSDPDGASPTVEEKVSSGCLILCACRQRGRCGEVGRGGEREGCSSCAPTNEVALCLWESFPCIVRLTCCGPK